MCLYLRFDKNQNEKDLQAFIGDQEEIDVYKILRKDDDENFYRSENYPDYIWDFSKQRIFQVDRPSRPTGYERNDGCIEEGFHVYTSLKVAEDYRWDDCTVIVKFRVRAEDVVAVENDRDYNNFQELVCTKLIYVEVVPTGVVGLL
jgi:hypothetical protein